jgi:hypothetical protein
MTDTPETPTNKPDVPQVADDSAEAKDVDDSELEDVAGGFMSGGDFIRHAIQQEYGL